MAAEEAKTLAETLAQKNESTASAVVILFENGDGFGSEYGGDDKIENGRDNKIENGVGFGTENGGETSEGQNGKMSYGTDVGVVVESQLIETKIAIEEIFGPSDVGVLYKDAENGGDSDIKGSLDSELDKKGGKNNISLVEILPDECVGKRDRVKGKDVENVSLLCKDAENVGGSDIKGLLSSEDLTDGAYRRDNDKSLGADQRRALDKGLEVETKTCLGERFGTSNGKALSEETKVILGPGFSKNDCSKVDKNGISFVDEMSNYNGVEGKVVENVSDQEHVYSVGDFVWGKFNSHPWWPAQIYDPSDASDHAKKCCQGGRPLLVAYFGDGSFSWRSPSQLKPFAENFDELSEQSDSIIFLTAVQSALDEIGRVAELKMTCPCISEENKSVLIREGIVNAGIKERVIGPKCDFIRLPISGFKPSKLLSNLRSITVGNMVNNKLVLTGLRSCLSAFYRARDGRKLVCYHEGLMIEGMEDGDRNGFTGGNDGSIMQKCSILFKNKHKDTRKRKSAAIILKENAIVKADGKKEMKSIGESPISSVNSISSYENGHDKGQEKALNDNTCGVLEEETRYMSASRKRKKSRYLSYPYTDLSFKISASKRDLAAESVKISTIACVGERMTSAAANLYQSSPILKNQLFETSDNGGGTLALSDPGPQVDDQKKMIEPAKIKASLEKVISEVCSAALDPKTFLGSDSCDKVNDFICAYRSVFFVKGSTDKPPSKKRKSLSSKPGLGVKGQNETHEEMNSISELKSVAKKKNKKAKKIMEAVTSNEGLLLIKQKLEKVTSMVKNCDGDTFPGVKLSLETEMKGLVEKISTMLNAASS